MSKPRSDSPLSALSEAQTETLEGWLFEEKLGYVPVLERLEKEFGVKASHSALGRFYQRTAARRAQIELLGVEKAIADLAQTPLGHEACQIAMTLVVKRIIQLALEKPGKVRQMAALMRVMLAHRTVEVREGWLNLGRQRELKGSLTDKQWAEERAKIQQQLAEYFTSRGMPLPLVPGSEAEK